MDNIHTDYVVPLTAALRLIADIREAAGDPEGKLMQDELVATIRRMQEERTEIHSAVGDPDGKLTSKQLLARINAMTVTLTALTSGEDHNQIISRVTNFAAEVLK